MHKNMLILVVTALMSSLASAGSSLYDRGWYIGGGGSAFQYEEKFFGQTFTADLSGVDLRGGFQYSDVLAFEGRLGMGTGDDTDEFSVSGTTYEANLELLSYGGLYLKVGIPNTRWVYPYLLFGATVMEFEVSLPDFDTTESDSGGDLSFGGGVDININKNFAAYVEYLNWYNKDRVEITGFSAGIIYRF